LRRSEQVTAKPCYWNVSPRHRYDSERFANKQVLLNTYFRHTNLYVSSYEI